MQDPQGLWVPTLAGAGEVVAGQGLAAGLDRVQHIALGVVAAAVGVDPDDGVSLALEQGMAVAPPDGDRWLASAWVGVTTRRQDCGGSRPPVDRL